MFAKNLTWTKLSISDILKDNSEGLENSEDYAFWVPILLTLDRMIESMRLIMTVLKKATLKYLP